MEPRKREVCHFVSSTGINVFQQWLDGLKDVMGRAVILKRIDRLYEGLLGDHRYVGAGVWELRINFGPGYRVYFGEADQAIILLLLGGDKGSQHRDIRMAQTFWAEYRRIK